MNQIVTNENDSPVVYSLDQDRHIVDVNDSWNKFALDNEAPHLERNQVLNRPLWDYIADAETRHVHRVLMERVTNKQSILEVPFRCDSPSVRRFMQMKIVPNDEGAVTYNCKVERIEHRAPVQFLEQKKWREKKLLRMCSWCKKVDVGDNIWLEIEAAVEKLQLLERKILPEISHTMCDECLNKLDDSTS